MSKQSRTKLKTYKKYEIEETEKKLGKSCAAIHVLYSYQVLYGSVKEFLKATLDLT